MMRLLRTRTRILSLPGLEITEELKVQEELEELYGLKLKLKLKLEIAIN